MKQRGVIHDVMHEEVMQRVEALKQISTLLLDSAVAERPRQKKVKSRQGSFDGGKG